MRRAKRSQFLQADWFSRCGGTKDLGTPSAAILRAVIAAPPLALLQRAIESFLGLKLQRA